jgi:hypothetical protein
MGRARATASPHSVRCSRSRRNELLRGWVQRGIAQVFFPAAGDSSSLRLDLKDDACTATSATGCAVEVAHRIEHHAGEWFASLTASGEAA